MGQVQVDVLGLQSPQRGFHGADDVPSRESLIVRTRPHGAAHLGGEHDALAVAACLHPAADDLLGDTSWIALGPVRVDVGRVDEVAAGFDVRVEHGKRDRLVGRPTELHGAQAQR
jgi:hypothetical protein